MSTSHYGGGIRQTIASLACQVNPNRALPSLYRIKGMLVYRIPPNNNHSSMTI